MQPEIKDLIISLVTGLIKYPNRLVVHEDFSGETMTELSLSLHGADVPRVKGKNGRHFKAVKRLVEIAGRKLGLTCDLTMIRPTPTAPAERFPTYVYNPDWPRESVRNIIEQVFNSCTVVGAKRISHTEKGGRCRFEVVVNAIEKADLIEDVVANLTPLLTAIGMNAGCVVALSVSRE